MAAVLAPPLVARVWGVPFRLLSVSVVLRTAVVAALITATLALFAAAALRLAGWVPLELGPSAGAGAGLVLGLLVVLVRNARDRGPKAVLALSLNLRDPQVGEDASARLAEHLARARAQASRHGSPQAAARLARMALLASGPLVAAAGAERAAEHLRSVPADRLPEETRGRWARVLAGLELQLGDASAAQRVVDQVDRPAPEPEVERWLATIDALVAASTGEPGPALALPDEPPGKDASPEALTLRCLRLAARAHAHASLGDRAAAHRELEAIRAIAPAALAFVRTPIGPATSLLR